MSKIERKVREYEIRFEDGDVVTFTPKDIEDLQHAAKLKRLLKDLYWATV